MGSGEPLHTLPVDKGWAWVICFAGFLVHIIFGSSGQTNTVMLGELIEKYDTTITTISLMFTFGISTFSLFSVISATFILPKIGEKKCVIIGGILASISSIGQGLSPHVAGIIAMEAVRGTAHGIIFVPAMCLTRQYFKRLRSTASVIVFCGGCVAAIVAPFIIRQVRKEYGITGTYLLLSAMELHFVVAGLLLRPVTAYRNVTPSLTLEVLGTSATVPDAETTVDEDVETGEVKETPLLSVSTGNINGLTKAVKVADRGQTNGVNNGVADAEVKERLLRSTSIEDPMALRPRLFSRGMSVDSTGGYRSERIKANFGSVLTLTSEHGAAAEGYMETQPQPDSTDKGGAGKSRFQKFYSDASLNLWAFRLALVAVIPGTVTVYIAIYTPMILHSQGASLDEVSILLTIVGTLDLISRLSMGFLADTHILSATVMLLISQIFIGVVCQFVGMFNSFETLILLSVLLGLVIGTRISLLPLVVIEVVGVEKMPQAFSIISMISTITAAGVNPLFGAVTEASGAFHLALHILGGFFWAGALLWAFVPLMIKVDLKKGRRTS
ncbi:unnamed protein product [Lymnaea stagnalis]|uniref:Major facilitator superfamily (MFS) profile domain-containing protein n=1 Tax=Lymnaea stagnalis TaxID=6523 RepID=A0AAV2I6T5_LYMST